MPRLRAPLLAAIGLSAAFAPSAQAIVGGTDVPDGKRDYVALIIINNAFQCTGTLAAPDVVITAGHCSSISGAATASPIPTLPQLFDVTLGTNQASGEGGVKAAVSEVIVHPQYSSTNLVAGDRGEETDVSNDVSILKLTEPVVGITPVPIANDVEEGLWTPGTLAQIAGFGTTSSGGDTPPIMKETEVPIVEDAKSLAVYPDSFEAATQIGAGFVEGGKDSCQGDSGGPLIVPTADGTSLRLVGDTSYGSGCADPDTPGIYGRIAGDELREFFLGEAKQVIAGQEGASAGPVIVPPTVPVDTGAGTTPQPSPTPTADGSGSGSGSGTAPAPSPTPTATASTAARLGISAAIDARRLRRALPKGARVRIRCTQTCSTTTTLTVSAATARRYGLKSRTVASGKLTGLTGRKTYTVRFTADARKKLRRVKRLSVALRVVATSGDGQRKVVARNVALKR